MADMQAKFCALSLAHQGQGGGSTSRLPLQYCRQGTYTNFARKDKGNTGEWTCGRLVGEAAITLQVQDRPAFGKLKAGKSWRKVCSYGNQMGCAGEEEVHGGGPGTVNVAEQHLRSRGGGKIGRGGGPASVRPAATDLRSSFQKIGTSTPQLPMPRPPPPPSYPRSAWPAAPSKSHPWSRRRHRR